MNAGLNSLDLIISMEGVTDWPHSSQPLAQSLSSPVLSSRYTGFFQFPLPPCSLSTWAFAHTVYSAGNPLAFAHSVNTY